MKSFPVAIMVGHIGEVFQVLPIMPLGTPIAKAIDPIAEYGREDGNDIAGLTV